MDTNWPHWRLLKPGEPHKYNTIVFEPVPKRGKKESKLKMYNKFPRFRPYQ